jgi:hypothetical protein
LPFLHHGQQFDLLPLLQDRKVAAEKQPAAFIHTGNSVTVGLLQRPQRTAELNIDVIDYASPSCAGISIRRNDSIASRGEGFRFVYCQETPRRASAATGDGAATSNRSDQSRLKKFPPTKFVGWLHTHVPTRDYVPRCPWGQ